MWKAIAYVLLLGIFILVVRWSINSLRQLPPYVGPLGRAWHIGFRIFCGFVLLYLIVPIIVIMPLSFNSSPYFTYPMPGVSLRWYISFISGGKSAVWHLAIKNSIIVAFSATFLATLLGTLAAVGLSNSRLPFKTLLMGVLISPMIVPLVITGVGMYFFYTVIGMTPAQISESVSPNLHLLPIIMAHAALGTPFVVITVTATLVGFDRNLIRASQSLGADGVTTFLKVTVPLVLPGMISGALFAFITSFDEVVIVLFLSGAQEVTIPRQMFSGIREQISPTILAVATVLVCISIVLLASIEMMRRRNERLRGITPA